MQGGPGEKWAIKIVIASKNRLDGKPSDSGAVCCSH